MKRSPALPMLLLTLTIHAVAQTTTPPISLDGQNDGRSFLVQTNQSPNPYYYRPVAPQARQAPCGGFSTPPCTGQTLPDNNPTAEQLFIAAKQADANHQPQQSIDYLTRSAKMGYRKAQYALGTDYQKGNGVPQDLQKAKYWLDLAAQQGSQAATTSLQQIDPGQSTHYLEMGAAHRDSQADFDLGMNYELGHGVPHDRTRAMQYLRKASIDGGNPTGEQIAAALARTAPSRRFQSKDALMALVPAAKANVATSRPAGCPAWYDSTYRGDNVGHLITVSRTFCIVHPGCPFSIDLHDYTCKGDQTPLHY